MLLTQVHTQAGGERAPCGGAESGGHAAVCTSSFNLFSTRQHVHRHLLCLHMTGDGHLSRAAPPLAHLVINRHIMLARQGVTDSISGAVVTPPACLLSCRIRRATRREPSDPWTGNLKKAWTANTLQASSPEQCQRQAPRRCLSESKHVGARVSGEAATHSGEAATHTASCATHTASLMRSQTQKYVEKGDRQRHRGPQEPANVAWCGITKFEHRVRAQSMQRTARRQGRAAGHRQQKEYLVVGASADTLRQRRTAALARTRGPEPTTTPVSTAIVGTSAVDAPAGCQAL